MPQVGKPTTAEMHPGPGLQIRRRFPPPAADSIAALGAFATPQISDLMNRLYTMASEVHGLTAPQLRMVGPAITVKTYPGDNLMVHKALDMAEPGDVIVVDTGGALRTAVMGDLVATKARHRGVAGFVVDGLIRDLPGILELGDFPVYARGVTPIGPLHRGPGEINQPICAGGIVVNPGDVIVADLNGVVVVPAGFLKELLLRLTSRAEAEADYVAAVERGEFSNDWVDATLRDTNVLIEPDSG